MNASSPVAAEDFPVSDALDVMAGNRVFPDRPPRPKGQCEDVLNLNRDSAKPTLAKRLAEALWDRMPYAQFANSQPAEANMLVKAYVDSLLMIQRFQADVEGLFRIVCETNLEFRQASGNTNEPARDQALRTKLDEMMSRAGMPLGPPPSILTAAFVVQPIERMHEALIAGLRDTLEGFGKQFETALQHLVAQRLMGLIEWVGSNACRYHFFKEVILQENDGFATHSETTTTVPRATRVTDEHGRSRRLQGLLRIREGQTGRHFHRWARHEHHVMQAFHTTIRNCKIVMPPEARRLADAIPDWLYDLVEVIDGEIIRQRIIECDYRQEAWEDLKTREVPIYGPDPAIVIDQFVLTGWGPKEVEAEQARCDFVDLANRAHLAAHLAWRERLAWSTATVGTTVASVSLFGQAVDDTLRLRFWSGVLMVAGLYAATQVVRTHGQMIGRDSRIYHYLAGVLIAGGFIASGVLILLGKQLGSPVDALMGAGLFILSIVGVTQAYRLWSRSDEV